MSDTEDFFPFAGGGAAFPAQCEYGVFIGAGGEGGLIRCMCGLRRVEG